ncbi:hypothetical protein ABW19_dt0210460 [Dactylella cylindrospora]|nr:hypothetical protein ABW19_dt0210460 [Dactylella cylindrospora]
MRGTLVILSAVLYHGLQASAQTTTSPQVSSTTQTTTPTASSKPEPEGVKFWKQNWLWFLIGFIVVLIPILIWAALGPGKKWYRNRKRRNSVPILWNDVGTERFRHFQNPSMRDIRQISRSRGSGSSSRSDVALSSNAAAPGEQDIEAIAGNHSPTNSTSVYVQRERMRNDSSEAVIGLVQPQSPMPPMLGPADRSSVGSFGPPDPHIHRAHPRYNSFQRYSRQHRRRQGSLQQPPADIDTTVSAQRADLRESLRESMQLPSTQIPQRKSLPTTPTRQSIQANTAMQRVPMPQMPKPSPYAYHIRQGSVLSLHSQHSSQSGHSRSTSWHHTTHRQAIPTNPYPSRHASMDGYHPISEPTQFSTPVPAPRRSTSRGRLQKPQHLNPRNSQQAPQQPREQQPQMSFYRPPQPSRENLGWPLGTSETSITTTSAPRPTVPKPVYPARSAMSNKSQPKEDRVYGTESGYSYSITAGNNPPVKSVKFAALPPSHASVPGRFPIRHF